MLVKRLLFALFFFPLCLYAQNNYVFQHVTADDGLISNTNTNIFQDAEGFYWFVNVNGFQRFDDKNFETNTFHYNPENPVKIDDWIGQSAEDNAKDIWILNSQGINIFNRKKSTLSRLYMPDAADSSRSNVAAVIKDTRSVIWIITSKNIFIYSDALHKPVLYSRLITDLNESIQNAQFDTKRNCFWLMITGATRKIASFNIQSKQLNYPLRNNTDSLLGHADQVSFFMLDESDNIWLANYVGDFCRYNITEEKLVSYNILHTRNSNVIGFPNSTIKGAIDDKNGSVWFGGDYYIGLLRYDKHADKFYQQENDNGSEYGFHYNEIIYNFYQDTDNNIWIDTDLGMNVFNPRSQKFKYLNPKSESSVTHFNTDVSSIFQSSSGDVWVSTWGDGVFEYDSNFILIHHYVHDKNNAASFGEPLNRAWCFAEDKKGRIIIGCQYGMVSMYDTVTKKFTNKIISAFEHSTIMHAIKDGSGNIWFGLYNGLIAKFDDASNDATVFKNSFSNVSKSISPVDALCIDNSGNAWWGPGENGLRKFNAQTNIVEDSILYPLHIFSPSFINDSMLTGGTDNKGFFILNKHTRSAQFFNTMNGLSSNDVFGAIASNNNFWIFGNEGINLLDISSNKVSHFGIDDGIRDHELQSPFYQLKNGIILFTGKTGICYFNPDSIKTKPPPPNVCITDLRINEHSYSVDSLLGNKTISLTHDQNVITIEYAALSFNGRAADKYYYELSGVDKDWISAGAQRSVTYANLSPGHYIFSVYAQNTDGINTRAVTKINININAPWWQTWWAYILWFLIAVFIMYAIYNYRKSNREALSHIRQKIASDLHDDIGSTLNSISVYSEVASQQLESNTENAKNILQKMGNASRNMIDTMNDIVWSVNPKNDQFENILQRMRYFSGELLSGKNILLQFNAEEKIKNIKMPMEKRKNFYLIFKEAMNNACKYSKARNVHVHIKEEAGKLVMIIADDGIGFNTANQQAGNGLKNMQARAHEMHAILNITSFLEKGTSIELIVPVKKF